MYVWEESPGFQESPGFLAETPDSCQWIASQSSKSSEEEKLTEDEHEGGEASDSFGVDEHDEEFEAYAEELIRDNKEEVEEGWKEKSFRQPQQFLEDSKVITMVAILQVCQVVN